MKPAMVVIVVATTLAGCGGRGDTATGSAPVMANWRKVATAADRDRLRRWRNVWLDAANRARASGAGREMTAQGVLFDPDLALADALPPPGDYRCRVFKLGAKRSGMRDFTAYPAYSCRIEQTGGVSTFRKTGGSQRVEGRIFAEPPRAVFLGTLVLGDEARALAYGRDATRDMAGIVERIGERRWRMALPLPAFESTLDIIELVPAT